MRPAQIRVLVVEDSPTMRHHLRAALAQDAHLSVVGEAADGRQAVELCGRLKPDVVTMDIRLPVMSGVAATEQIMAQFPTPILVVSAADRTEVYNAYEALAAGAVDILEKPRGDSSDDFWGQRLRAAVRLVARIRVITHPRARLATHRQPGSAGGGSAGGGSAGGGSWAVPPAGAAATAPRAGQPLRVVVIGASTGGPAAVIELLKALPAGYPVPILLVQHISTAEPFAVAFADWLGEQTGRDVSYAQNGTAVQSLAGRVVMAPPDRHLVVRDGMLQVNAHPPRHSCRPSVDVLFESVAGPYGAAAAGCLLTGMGRDGAAGLLALRQAGGRTFAQDEATSVVYGMPREAALLGAAGYVLPPAQIGSRLAALVPIANRTGDR